MNSTPGVVQTRGLAGAMVKVPGLRHKTGAWAICHGIFSPVILVDASVPIERGYNALVVHESFHARERHKLKEILILLATPALVGFYFWFRFRRNIETAADKYAYAMFGDREYRAFLYLHKEPSSWWGRWIYGATHAERYMRCTGKDL